jgi:16S rRNA (uracil1498-N3)-methyltransferase
MDPVRDPTGPADVAATAHVYVERLDDTIRVGGDDGHHLTRVRRLRPDELVTAADGYGRWRAYAVDAVDGGTVALHATSDFAHEVPLAPRLSVACALTKGERPELVVQKLTELGADTIVLVLAARSVVRWDVQRERTAMERLRRIAREAGAQCRRARLPVLDGPVPLADLAGRAGLVVADRDGAPAGALPEPVGGEWIVVVGPEGGLDRSEHELFADAPRLSVGQFVLRAETAAIAAAAALAGRRSRST